MTDASSTKPPHGPDIANRRFGVHGQELIVGGARISDIVAQAGSPVFVYDASIMRQMYRDLAEPLKGFARIHYSVKANPAREVIKLFLEEGAGVEIASLGEYRAALAAGAQPEQVLFAGPGKRLRELEAVIRGGIGEIHLETTEEVERVNQIAVAAGKIVKCSLRVNPVAAAQAGAMRMGGKPTAFGFCEEEIDAVHEHVRAAKAIELVGVHVYGGTQILDAAALTNQWRHAIRIAGDIAQKWGAPLQTIDLGGGLGIPYYQGETELDLTAIKAAIPELMAQLRSNPLIANADIIVEPGRYLAGPAGVYAAEVNAVKISRGTRFVITDGGMHHHLAASGNLGQIIKRDFPVVAANRMAETNYAPATVVGPLCTPLDTLARDTQLPDLKAGDLVAVLQSGAYGATASPSGFLSHEPAAEVLVENGIVRSAH